MKGRHAVPFRPAFQAMHLPGLILHAAVDHLEGFFIPHVDGGTRVPILPVRCPSLHHLIC